jgi:hypothetical protein
MSIVLDERAARILDRLSRSLGDDRPFLLPANICPIVPETLAAAGRRLRFVDIARDAWCMDRERCLDLLERDPDGFAGIVFVRAYGVEGDEASFFSAVRHAAPHTLIIDDKCLCRPDCDARSLSAGADITLFSTGYAKHVDLGGGGFAYLTTERTLPAMRPVAEDVWAEYRSRTVTALERADAHKAVLNEGYAAGLPAETQLPDRFQRWRFNILVPRSEELIASLFGAGLFASRHYQPVTGRFSDERFPASEWLHDRIVNLFNDRYFTRDQARRTIGIARHHLGLAEG